MKVSEYELKINKLIDLYILYRILYRNVDAA